jgi:predicted aconitase
MALTGRAPHAGAHLAAARAPTLELRVAAEVAAQADDLLYPALGYACGLHSDARVPLVTGLEGLSPTQVVVE